MRVTTCDTTYVLKFTPESTDLYITSVYSIRMELLQVISLSKTLIVY